MGHGMPWHRCWVNGLTTLRRSSWLTWRIRTTVLWSIGSTYTSASPHNSGMIIPFITPLDVTKPKIGNFGFQWVGFVREHLRWKPYYIYIHNVLYTHIYIYICMYMYMIYIYVFIYLFKHYIYYCIFLLFPSSNSRIDSSTALGWLFETGFDWYSELACRAQSTSKINAQFFQHISNAGAWATDHHCCDVGMDQYLLIPFLGEWTSIYQLFWCSPGVQGFDTLPYRNNLNDT